MRVKVNAIASQSLIFLALTALQGIAQPAGQLSGIVTLQDSRTPMHGVSVVIVELDRSTLSEHDGTYEFSNVPPGTYHVLAHLDHIFTETEKTVTVEAGKKASLDFLLSVAKEEYEITVTASDKHETTFESFQDVEAFDSFELAETPAASLGEVLDHLVGTGIAKRSSGPGSSLPIIRGFDGDRVLIMEDGIRTGTLSAQSGHHGEVINSGQLDQLEIVKGPATLLYSGNAMGGTVNAVSRHHEHHRHPHQGLRGSFSGSGGTTNSLGGGSAFVEAGIGKFLVWGHAGGIRTGDYGAPRVGTVFNSRTSNFNGGGGFGWYGDKIFFSAEARLDRGQFGLPFAEEHHGHQGGEDHHDDGEEEEEHHDDGGGEDHHDDGDEEEHHEEHEEEIERIAVESRRANLRVTWGLHEPAPAIESFVMKLAYTDWEHDEVEYFDDGHSMIGTTFQNNQFIYRGMFEQVERGPLSGRFGFWGIDRAYQATGEEALTPPIDQNGLAFFALEVLDFEHFKVQFGGRVETQRYRPAFSEREVHHEEEMEEDHHELGAGHGEMEEEHHEEEAPAAIDRNFTGASASVGIHTDLWKGGAFVANFAHSYRVPSLEELYNFGPHAGTVAFEVGDPSLGAERGNGVDVSLRHQGGRVRGELNYFYYKFNSFIFPFLTGGERGGLREIEFTQRDVRYTGMEANLGINLGTDLWLNLGMDRVDAKETVLGTPLPRIPPLRGKVGIHFHRGRFHLSPDLVLASRQNQTFTGETTTPGYTVMNLKASYTYAQRHLLHEFSVNVFNLADRLYRNHSSYIKDLAPEMGRGVRFTHRVRFF